MKYKGRFDLRQIMAQSKTQSIFATPSHFGVVNQYICQNLQPLWKRLNL